MMRHSFEEAVRSIEKFSKALRETGEALQRVSSVSRTIVTDNRIHAQRPALPRNFDKVWAWQDRQAGQRRVFTVPGLRHGLDRDGLGVVSTGKG